MANSSHPPSHMPGFSSPGVGFEQPFEMLLACHQRVQRTLSLLERLLAHIDQHGHDAASRSAAADVLRYFDIAAPLHHQDEELHIFPALAAQTALQPAIAQLLAEHERLTQLWAELRPALLTWRDAPHPAAPTTAERTVCRDFVALYQTHIAQEETQIYPAAAQQFNPEGLARIGAEMQGRRRQ